MEKAINNLIQEEFENYQEITEEIKENNDIQGIRNNADSFKQLYEESLKSICEGELVTGEIIGLDNEYVLVNIGHKSMGQIPSEEFIDADGKITAEVGDSVEVLLETRKNMDGMVILSKEKATKIKIWDKIKNIYENNEVIKGKIISRVKGGMNVDIGIPAFLPGSQIALRPVKDMNALINNEYEFKIVKYNKRRGNIVISRRSILEDERMRLRQETLKKIEEGEILQGTVKNITDYGIFIDLGGIDGLVHITDISWGRVGHPSEKYKLGDTVTVTVFKFDKEKERVSLGIKQLKTDPWLDAETNFKIGSRVQGTILSMTGYGAFVQIAEGIEGLIHITEMSWTKKIRHPSQVLKKGDQIEAIILDLDVERKRISLGLKQIEPNIWNIIGEKYPIGTIIEGKIKNITDFGLFIGIDEGIDGLVHISDISWTKRIRHPSDIYRKAQAVQAIVLNIDKKNEKFSLGIKQLTADPWDEIPHKYKSGNRVTGIVTNVTDFGLFLELEEGIEGLIHISEIDNENRGNGISQYQIDDVIQAQVMNVSKKEKKIGLSIKRLMERKKDFYGSYLNNREEATLNLGDLLREGMMNFQQQDIENDISFNETSDLDHKD